MAVGVVFTGKTWCNYVCPVSFVEKLYTEPRGLRDTPNSQCATCTACKPACPDINEENSYWKEILAPAKARAYFAFPGVVLAFYGVLLPAGGDLGVLLRRLAGPTRRACSARRSCRGTTR